MDTLLIITLNGEEFEKWKEELVTLYVRAYENLPEYRYHHPEKIREYLSWLWHGDPEGFMVAMEKGVSIGFISIHGAWEKEGEVWGEVHEFVVHPDYRKRGIGTTLFETALKYAQEKGRTKCGLWVGVKNEEALAFYRKRGFIPREQWGKWIRMVKEMNGDDAP